MGDSRAADTSEQHLLLSYLRDRDVPCPACGYNLRDLTAPICPECRQDLTLSVGLRKPEFLWFIVLVTPGLFSIIAAGLLAVPLFGSLAITGQSQAPWQIWAIDGFGWCSGLTTLALIRWRFAFLRLGRVTQRTWALAAWLIHVLAFVAAIVLATLA